MVKIDKKDCIIVGAGTYGQVYLKYLRIEYNVIAFIDDDISVLNENIDGIEVVGNIEHLINNINRNTAIFVPIGNNKVREQLLNRLISEGFKTPSFIHKSVTIGSSVQLGTAVYILPNSSIMPLTQIGDYVMVSMGVNIAHHVNIQSGVFVSQGSNIGASIDIKPRAFLGIASTVMTGVEIVGTDSLIGAGSVVIRNVPNGATVVGNPGRVINTK